MVTCSICKREFKGSSLGSHAATHRREKASAEFLKANGIVVRQPSDLDTVIDALMDRPAEIVKRLDDGILILRGKAQVLAGEISQLEQLREKVAPLAGESADRKGRAEHGVFA